LRKEKHSNENLEEAHFFRNWVFGFEAPKKRILRERNTSCSLFGSEKERMENRKYDRAQ